MTTCPTCGSPVCVCTLLVALAHNPTVWRLALLRSRQPLPHPAGCPCPADIVARIIHNFPDPVLDPDNPNPDEEIPVPRPKKKKAPAPPAAPGRGACPVCGVGVDPHPDSDTARRGAATWITCPDCRRHRGITATTATMLTALNLDYDARDTAVTLALTRLPWRADRHPTTSTAVPANPHGVTVAGAGFSPTNPRGTGAAKPWAHLTAADVTAAVETARADLAPARPRRCTAGPCPGCGVQKSVRWIEDHDLQRPDGGKTVFCADCWPLFEKAGGSHDMEFCDWLLANAVGLTRPPEAFGTISEDYQFKTWWESGVYPEGTPDRFGYLSAEVLDAVRKDIWRRWPRLAPPEVRERLARAAAASATVAKPLSPPPPLVMPTRERTR